MRGLRDAEREELKDYLGKGWYTHYGMWLYHTYLGTWGQARKGGKITRA